MVKNKSFKNRFLNNRYPKPKIIPGNIPDNERSKKVIRLTSEAIKDSTFDAPLLGSSFSVIDYFSKVKPILDLVEAGITFNNANENKEFELKKENLAELDDGEMAASALLSLYCDVASKLILFGRVNSQLYFFERKHGKNSDDKWFEEITIHAEKANVRTFASNGKTRKAFKCGRPNQFTGIKWIEWNGSEIEKYPGKQYPVFIQSHALDQLFNRVPKTENEDWFAHDDLMLSLLNPKIVKKNGDEFLIEYRWLSCKLGYLTAIVIDDCVLITTFLFLTMDGTPEGALIREKLRLERPDKEHLELDKIETFLHTDMKDDPEIVKLLSGCGCGHLFSLPLVPTPKEHIKSGYADGIRDFLELAGRS